VTIEPVLLDTGPMVAAASRSDAHHTECVRTMAEVTAPLYTCWPCVTEALWLLRRDARAVDAVCRSLQSGVYALLPPDESDVDDIHAVLKRYRSLGAQLADAALVHLAEREQISVVFTLDRRDFAVYRHSRNRAFTIIPEPA
jgi:predicted nucleic acid-binding protein